MNYNPETAAPHVYEFSPDLFFEKKSYAYRMKYEALNNMFYKEISSHDGSSFKFIMMINLKKFVTMDYKYRSSAIHRYAAANGDTSDANINRALVLSVFNTLAHYNHFFYNRVGSHISFALYFSDTESYSKHKPFIDLLSHVCSFTPNIHLIREIPATNPFSQALVAPGLALELSKTYRESRKNVKMLWLGPNALERQTNIFTDSFEIIREKIEMEDPNSMYKPSSDHRLFAAKGVKEVLMHKKIVSWWDDLSFVNKSLIYTPWLGIRNSVLRLSLNLTDKEKSRLNSDFPFKIGIETNKNSIDNMMRVLSNQEDLLKMNKEELRNIVFSTVVKKNLQNPLLKERHNAFCSLIDIRDRQDVLGSIHYFLPLWTKKMRDKTLSLSLSRLLNGNEGSLNTEWLFEGVGYV